MLPPIPMTRNERREEAQLRRFAQSITSTMIAERASMRPAPLIGATALRLVLGLSRPSRDLDFCGASLDGRTLNQITRAIENAGHEVTGHVGVSHKPSKYELHIRNKRSFLGFRPHARILTIDLGMLIALPQDLTEVQAGILTPKPEKLLDLKLEAFCGERHRTEIRDLYDATWIHERFPDRVLPARSHAFAMRAADALTDRNRSRWRRLQTEDRFLSRIQWPALEQSVRETIEAVYERHGPVPR